MYLSTVGLKLISALLLVIVSSAIIGITIEPEIALIKFFLGFGWVFFITVFMISLSKFNFFTVD